MLNRKKNCVYTFYIHTLNIELKTERVFKIII